MFLRKKIGPFKLRGLAAEQTGGLFLIAPQAPYFLSLRPDGHLPRQREARGVFTQIPYIFLIFIRHKLFTAIRTFLLA